MRREEQLISNLPIPTELPSDQARIATAATLEQERKRAAALSTRNRSKSTSDEKACCGIFLDFCARLYVAKNWHA